MTDETSQLSEGVGAVALTEEQQVLTAQNDNPEHPRGNEELAEAMGDVMRPIEQMINNINGSKLHDKESRVADLRSRGHTLAEEAEERYIVEKRQYDEVRDKSLGDLIYAAASLESQNDDTFYRSLLEVYPTAEGTYSQSRNMDDNTLTPQQMENLVTEIFTVAGADPQSLFNPRLDWKSLSQDTNGWRNVTYDTNLGNGMKIIEQHMLDDESGKLTQVRFSAVNQAYLNNIESPQE